MGTLSGFMSTFGGCGGAENVTPESPLLAAGAPNALGAFMEQFSNLTESYKFYGGTEELRYNKEEHVYYRVNPDLGNLEELYGVTNVLRIIDRSNALVPWGCKMMAEKLLRTIPTMGLTVPEMSLEAFTKLVMEAKNAHKEILTEAGDIGHAAHECLERSIQHAIDHTGGIVLALRDLPTEEKALACAQAGFRWMEAHNVRWIKTEQKIYSKKYKYAGTTDGLAWIDSCEDKSCCSEQYKEHLTLVDWKSSNALHEEYCYQTAGYLAALLEEFKK